MALFAVAVIATWLFILTIITGLIESRKELVSSMARITEKDIALIAVQKEFRAPRVLSCYDPYPNSEKQDSELCVFLEASKIFDLNSVVAIFNVSGIGGEGQKLESLVGDGIISNIQADGAVIVTVLEMLPHAKEIWAELKKDNQSAKDKILVKSSFRYEFFVAHVERILEEKARQQQELKGNG